MLFRMIRTKITMISWISWTCQSRLVNRYKKYCDFLNSQTYFHLIDYFSHFLIFNQLKSVRVPSVSFHISFDKVKRKIVTSYYFLLWRKRRSFIEFFLLSQLEINGWRYRRKLINWIPITFLKSILKTRFKSSHSWIRVVLNRLLVKYESENKIFHQNLKKNTVLFRIFLYITYIFIHIMSSNIIIFLPFLSQSSFFLTQWLILHQNIDFVPS